MALRGSGAGQVSIRVVMAFPVVFVRRQLALGGDLSRNRLGLATTE
jgi:hypothetical protein